MKKKIAVNCILLSTIFSVIVIPHIASSRSDKQHYSYRYNAIKPLLNKYKRPITMLEFGTNAEHLSFNISKDYDAICAILDPYNAQQLLNVCKVNNHKNIILLSKHVSLDDLKRFGECEHFDVILAWDIFHYFKTEWQKAIDILLTFGDYIIIESPSTDNVDKKRIEQYLKHKQGAIFADSHQSNTIFLFSMNKNVLLRNHWDSPTISKKGMYAINSNFKEKLFIKRGTEVIPFIPGINLLTFKQLEGIYPSNNNIITMLEPLKHTELIGLNIHNLIVQGQQLVPIDCYHKPKEKHVVPHKVEKIIGLFR